MDNEVYPDVCTVALNQRDRLLLCSDGLTQMISDSAIADVLMTDSDCQTACRTLVDAANAAGGRDNITAVVVEWIGLPAQDAMDLSKDVSSGDDPCDG